MATLYLTEQGAVLSKTSERLNVTVGKERIAEIPLIKVSQVVVVGHVQITSPALRLLLDHDIEVCYVTQHGRYVGRTQPEVSKNVPLRIAQYQAYCDPLRRTELARRFVLGKLANLRITLLEKAVAADKTTMKAAVERIKAAERDARQTTELETLRAQEGEGSAAYFAAFPALLKTDAFQFAKRVRRPPTDPVNALLSFGYTLLLNDVCTACQIVGFDPYLGYLHAAEYGRPALPLDLMEEFRPLLVDVMVAGCLNKHILAPDDFHLRADGACRLTDAARRQFVEQYEQRRETESIHPALRQKITYQQCFEQQARLLAKTVQGELDQYPPFVVQ